MSGGKYGRGKAPERCCMKVAFWPHDDRERWAKACAPDDPFDPGGARANLRPISNAKTEKGYGRWLTYLEMTKQLDANVPAPDRITPDRVKAYIESLMALGNSSQTILSRLQELGDMAKAMAPERDWTWINRLASKVRARGKPARDKRSRVVSTNELLALGTRLIQAAGQAPTKRLAAIQFRDGLVIAFLALCPIRRKNLAGLELDRNVIHGGNGWELCLGPDETKTHAYYEVEWQDCIVPALELYLDVHRPVLMECKSRWYAEIGNALWVSSHGSPMTQIALYDVITRRTRDAFGRSINPHLFRDAAATTLAVDDPEHVRLSAALLGHRTFATTERYYQQAQMLSAQRKFAEVILSIRGTKVPQKRRRRAPAPSIERRPAAEKPITLRSKTKG